MAQKGIREYDAKRLMARFLPAYSSGRFAVPDRLALVTPDTDLVALPGQYPWMAETRLVVKPDQLFGKRAKLNLIGLDLSYTEVRAWIEERINRPVTIGKVEGRLTHFLVEPFVAHEGEHYLAFKSERQGDTAFFSMTGGFSIEDNWAAVKSTTVPIAQAPKDVDLSALLVDCPEDRRDLFRAFAQALYQVYAELGFAYLELNPFVVVGNDVVPLDTVARLDDAERFNQMDHWGDLEFPAPFGREMTPEEAFIKSVDDKTGASLKLTILNPRGRIWTMVAGGGASVIYADTVVDLGFSSELANYGEYSGDPSTEDTYLYARTILDLMTREPDPRGKVLLVGGGIANFTDVASTFTGIIQALEEHQDKLRSQHVRIYVRRGGPNYKIGLEKMRKVGETIGVPIEVYGPETHMTEIVSLAAEEVKR
jgi:ATP-citrate lyase beta-subunit